MERRRPKRTSSPSFLTGPAWALVLAATLLVVTGPGAAGSGAQSPAVTRPMPAAIQTDPIADLAWALQYDTGRIFRFVADEVRYEPYTGILRGAVGTLEARAGNSVDKALLLAALLDKSKVRYRFARGPLDAATTAQLVASMTADADAARGIARDALARGWHELTGSDISAPPTASGPLADLYDEQARATVADGEQRLRLAGSRLTETVTMIEDALDGAGIRLPADGVSLPPAEVASHTWVQIAYGATWRDLDPTLPYAAPDTVLTPAAERLDQLPDDLRYQVGFEVEVEHVAGGGFVTDPVLEYTTFADQIAGVPVTFGHITPSGIQRLGVTLRNLLGDGWIEYRPILDTGSGTLVADEAVAIPLAGGGGGLFGDSDLFGASPGASAAPVDGEATAEWIVVTVTGPASAPVVARRTVFDRLPADVRHGEQISVDTVEPLELVDVLGTGSMDFPPMLGIETFAVATGPTRLAALVGDPQNGTGIAALTYHVLRDALDGGTALDAGARTFLDGPNIVSFSVDIIAGEQAPKIRVGLDIWDRDHGVLPMTGPSVTPAEARLVAGVTAHITERLALEGLADAPGADVSAIGVGELFEVAATEGIPTRVLHDTITGPLPYGALANTLIEDAVASGDVVVVPAEPVTVGDAQRVGWWTIDPMTGETTDVMDDGSGSEMVEEAIIIDTELGRAICFGAFALRAANDIALAAALIGGGTLAASAIFRFWNAGWLETRCFAL